MRRKKILILPTLRDRMGDVTKKWYVEVSMRNPKTDEMIRRRFEMIDDENINTYPTAAERYTMGEKLIAELNAKLQAGWNIFEDDERVIYEDQTQYSAQARIFKTQVASNKNYAYWCSRYISEVLRKSNLRPATITTYESRYRLFKNWLIYKQLEHLDITSINNSVINDFFTYLRDDLKHTNHTFNSYAGRLSDLFDFVVKEKGIKENPVHSLPINKHTSDQGAEALHKEDLKKIMTVMDDVDPQLAMACRFEYYCGLRPGLEVRLMKVDDLNLRPGVSKVRVPVENNKAGRKKEVAIPDVFLNYLLKVWHLNELDKDFFVFGREKKPGLLHLGKNTLRDRFNKIRNKLGLPAMYKFYSMKHTGAVTLAEQGETIINIRDHLGHKDISTTEAYLKRLGFNDSEIIRHNFPEI